MSDLVKYLQDFDQMIKSSGFKFSIESFVLEHGQSFIPPIAKPDYKRGKIRECFKNALDAAMVHPELVYVEGFAIGVIPTLHAWCVRRGTDEAVELTWNKPGSVYFGYRSSGDSSSKRSLRRQPTDY